MDIQLGKKISLLTRMSGLTQSKVADHCKLSRISVNRFFKGHTDVRTSDFVEMLKLLDIDIEKQVDEKLNASLRGQAQAKPSSVVDDLVLILSNLDSGVQKTLLEQVAWWGRSQSRVPVDAVRRLSEHLHEKGA